MGEGGEITVTDSTQNLTHPLDEERKGKLMHIATEVKDGFVGWVDKYVLSGLTIQDHTEEGQQITVDYIKKRIENSPSKDLLKRTAAAVGLYDIGLTVAGLHMGVPKEVIPIIWSSTFFYPVCEELIYRSGAISKITTEIAKRMGLDVRPDKARVISNTLFAGLHPVNHLVDNFFTAPFLSKIAHEKGLSASIAVHSLINASILGVAYLSFAADKLPPAQAEIAKATLLATMWSGLTAMGISGIKEMMEDKQTQDALNSIRSTDRLNKSLKMPEIKSLYSKLLSHPSTNGYKFAAGVELAYITGMLESYEFMHQPEMRDNYSLKQVRKAVSMSCKDPEEIEERVLIAVNYVESKLKPKQQTGELPANTILVAEAKA